MDVLAVTMLILGLVALAVWRNHLHASKRMQIQKIIHEERMMAMEKGVAIEDLKHESLNQDITKDGVDNGLEQHGSKSLMWVRICSLCFGLIFFFGGVGMTIGFPLASDEEIKGMWSMGLIPVLIGIGLLLFYGLSKGYENKLV